MDVANPREDRVSECRSFGSTSQRFSQPRKVSIGVFANPVPNSQTKSVKETAIPKCKITSNETRFKDQEGVPDQGHTPVMEKEVVLSQKDGSPWVSTRSFKQKIFSVTVPAADRTPNFPIKGRPRSKLSAKVSIAHSVQYFGNKVADKKSNQDRQMSFDETENVNVEPEKNLEPSTEVVLPEKIVEEDRHGKTEAEGNNTLRMKLWEILGDVSSPVKQCPASQAVDLHDNQEPDREDCPIEKTNQKSDTIESDSENPDQTVKRPLTRSLARKKSSTRKNCKQVETKSLNNHRKECVQKDIFSFGAEWPGRLHDTVNDGLSTYKKKRFGRETSKVEKIQDHIHENQEKRKQSKNKRISASTSEKSNIQKNKVEKSNRSKRSDVVASKNKRISASNSEKSNIQKDKVEKSDRSRRSDIVASKKNISSEYPLNLQSEQKNCHELSSEKDQQKGIADSLLKNKIDTVLDSMRPTKSPVKSYPVLSESRGNLDNQSPINNVVDTPGLRSFKSLFNPRQSEGKSNAKDGEGELQDLFPTKLNFTEEGSLSKSSSDASDSESPDVHPKIRETKKGKLQDQKAVDENSVASGVRSFKSFLNSKPSDYKSNAKDVNGELKECFLTNTKSRFAMEEDRENRLSEYHSNTSDSESSDDDSNIKGLEKPEPLHTETPVAEKFLSDLNKISRSRKSIEMTQFSPISEPSREIDESIEHQIYLQQSQEEGMAGAVALLAVALNRVKTKLKSVSSIRSAEILRASNEEMLFQLQNAESQIKTDMKKLSSLSKLKRKRMETRFQEQQEQLLGIFKRFKEDVDQHLNNHSTFEELEEHETELKGIVEKQRETHVELLTQVEQAIKVQLNETESKIMAVQDSSRNKMQQLKLVVAECAKTFSVWSS